MTKYEIIRDILGVVAAIVIFMIFADKAKKKSRTLALILGCLAVFVVTHDTLNYIPFENLFRSFDTVEEAFYYQHKEKINIINTFDYDDYTIIETDSTDYGDHHFDYVLPKSEGKWKLDSVFSKKKGIVVEGDCVVVLLKIPKHNDCFLLIRGQIEGRTIENMYYTTDNIRDNRGTEFQKLVSPSGWIRYYALIEDLDSDYVLYVDDTPISID